jgi:uncharacterized protein with PQ loop repeat
MFNEIIGWTGNILFAICGIPQVIKTFRLKKRERFDFVVFMALVFGRTTYFFTS